MPKEKKVRLEKDSLGTYEVPADAKYGIFTSRAVANFKISGRPSDLRLIYALTKLKRSYALSHAYLKLIPKDTGVTIVEVCDEILSGKYDSQFPIDKYQAGAGTPINMNVNEVVANLANEKFGKPLGSYDPVNPNDTVNMGQSSNNIVPMAIRLAILEAVPHLLEHLGAVREHFIRLATDNNILKVGRTHLQDAVPINYRQVFNGYASSISRIMDDIRYNTDKLRELPANGTALGTGIASHPESAATMCKELSKLTGINFTLSDNPVELSWNTFCFAKVSGSLRDGAIVINKILNDLRILVSGPNAGIAEVILPEVEPGSSIMPGKVNPSIVECMNMICYRVIGNDEAVSRASGEGQLELNVMTPVMAESILESVDILTRGLDMVSVSCLEGLQLDKGNIKKHLDESLVFATALNPYLGYKVVAKVVYMAQHYKLSLVDTIMKYNLMDMIHIKMLLAPDRVTSPQEIDTQLVEFIQSSPTYKEFVEKYVNK